MSSEVVIGILTGSGPRTTAPFLDKIVTYCQQLYGVRDDSQLPHMIIYSLPIPYAPDKPIENEILKECLKLAVERLKNAQIDFLAIPTNYIYLFYDYITSLANVPILHIVKETIANLPKNNKKSALLAASSTIDSGGYQNELDKIGVEFFHNDELQDNVSQLIISIKQTGLSAHSQKLWKTVYNYCLENHCDSIINTNSDLIPCLKSEGSDRFVNITDSFDALALASVKKYLKLTENLNQRTG